MGRNGNYHRRSAPQACEFGNSHPSAKSWVTGSVATTEDVDVSWRPAVETCLRGEDILSLIQDRDVRRGGRKQRGGKREKGSKGTSEFHIRQEVFATPMPFLSETLSGDEIPGSQSNATGTMGDSEGDFQQALDDLKKYAEIDPDPILADQLEHARLAVFQGLKGRVKELTFDSHGCREVQIVLEHLEGSEQVTLVSELHGHVPDALESAHGNHVLQRCIELMRPSAVDFILLELSNTVCSSVLARHRYGCRVLERLIEHFPNDKLWVFLEGVLGDARALCFDSFGNFVIQHLLEHGSEDQKRRIVEVLLANLEAMAMDPHACSVLDKAVTYTSFQNHLAQAVLEKEELLPEMALLRGGCSATQSIFKILEGTDLETATRRLNDRLPEFQQTKHGKLLLYSLGFSSDQVDADLRPNLRASGSRGNPKGRGQSPQCSQRPTRERRRQWGTARRSRAAHGEPNAT